MYVLDNLWNCKIRPSERAFREGGQYADLMHKSRALEDAFYSELSSAGKKLYREDYEIQMQMLGVSEQDAFIKGVRFGARFMLDVIGEYDSPLPQVDGVWDQETTKTGDSS